MEEMRKNLLSIKEACSGAAACSYLLELNLWEQFHEDEKEQDALMNGISAAIKITIEQALNLSDKAVKSCDVELLAECDLLRTYRESSEQGKAEVHKAMMHITNT